MTRGMGGSRVCGSCDRRGSGVFGAQGVSAEEGTVNMVFFKGGFMNLNQDRSGQIFTDTAGIAGANGGNAGWYAGAGLDLVMSKDVWEGWIRPGCLVRSDCSSIVSIHPE